MEDFSSKFLDGLLAGVPIVVAALLDLAGVLIWSVLGAIVLPIHEPSVVNFVSAIGWMVLVVAILAPILRVALSLFGARKV